MATDCPDTRRKLNLHVPFCNKVSFKKCVVNMGTKLHNKMPQSVQKLYNCKLLEKN